MSRQTCHYLGTIDEKNNPCMPIDYPSFENRCLVEPVPAESSLLLADQATYCLSGGYSYCPRYQQIELSNHRSFEAGSMSHDGIEFAYHETLDASSSNLHPKSPATFPASVHMLIPLESDILNQTIDPEDGDYFFSAADHFLEGNRETQNRRNQIVWLVSSAAFSVVFLCGIILAMVAGWQLVQSNLLTALAEFEQSESEQPNTTNVELVENPTRAAIIIVVTATSESTEAHSEGDIAGNKALGVGAVQENESRRRSSLNQPRVSEQVQNSNQSTLHTEFPVAVTPTPIVLELDNQNDNTQSDNRQNGTVQENVVINEQQPSAVAPIVFPTDTPVLIIDVQVPLPAPPTRRLTPEFVIPSSTPLEVVPTDTPIPTAT